MSENHSITMKDIEKGTGAIKLEALKNRLLQEPYIDTFDSPDDLRSKIINILGTLRKKNATTFFHYISDIPIPPAPYIAHPYTLLQTRDVIGRQQELNMLTNWVSLSSSQSKPLEEMDKKKLSHPQFYTHF